MGEMFEAGKEYRLRDKSLARIYAIDGSGDESIHGARFCIDNGWILTAWHKHGGYVDNNRPHPRDLMASITICTQYVNIYSNGEISIMHDSRTLADHRAGANRIACVRVEIEYRDGQYDD